MSDAAPTLKTNSGTESYSVDPSGQDIDCLTGRDGYAIDGVKKRPVALYSAVDGTIEVQYNEAGTMKDTITFKAGVTLPLQPVKLLMANSTVTDCTLIYN